MTVSAMLAGVAFEVLLERVADPARVFDVCHGDWGVYGCRYVDFPGGRSKEERQELIASKR